MNNGTRALGGQITRDVARTISRNVTVRLFCNILKQFITHEQFIRILYSCTWLYIQVYNPSFFLLVMRRKCNYVYSDTLTRPWIMWGSARWWRLYSLKALPLSISSICTSNPGTTSRYYFRVRLLSGCASNLFFFLFLIFSVSRCSFPALVWLA